MSTAVAAASESKTVESASPKVKAKFLEAFNAGKLDKLSPEQQSLFLIALGNHLGLRAELGELMIYQGKPYITFAGRVRTAMNSALFVGMVPRPATPLERKNFQAEDGEHVWVCDVHRRGATSTFRGWGVAGGKAERNQQAGKTHPRQMAKKRACYDALRGAFPPDEKLTALHTQMIDAAEAEIEAQLQRTKPLLAEGDYTGDDPDDAERMEGEEIASVAPSTPAQIADDARRTSAVAQVLDANAPATDAQIARVIELSRHPVFDDRREKIAARLNSPLTRGTAIGWIKALEATIEGAERIHAEREPGEEPPEDLGLDDRRRRQPSAIEAGR